MTRQQKKKTMKLITEGNFDKKIHISEEHKDAFGNMVVAEDGFRLLRDDERVELGDKVFDIYAGWFLPDKYYVGRYFHFEGGRWTAWERKI